MIIDIETGPCYTREYMAELYPFKPENVKMGNIKDPEKRAAHLAKAEDEHYTKLEDKCLLDPLLSRVVAVGVENNGVIEINTAEDELELLTWTLKHLENTPIVGWNLHGFDLPYLFRRCWIRKLPTPKHLRRGKYWTDESIDLMKEFCLHEYGQFCSLERAAKVLGVNQPRDYELKGKDFWKAIKEDPEKARTYLTDDLTETSAIAKIIMQ